ncbi:DUF2644 domain-containing protein [Erwinia tracheiphila]|nr:DUF2644 domain-containing protein [Erwinia tracheiphila]UIA85480.1 DUF2644 domain-containing protein [Erwinia tracheiphila]UIA86376.1 DUF2644 domain-containing protein [Erwinia tracheiphila]UIA94001.1 DUF2644 domain-containing protein [Erwinia tracheiphila]UIA94696.1 DUF2644 domain-containing protein [Erwinia tracheiphila]
MALLNRLGELITNPQGRLSTTDAATMVALVVSSLALLVCVVMNREPDTALGLYLGAWVTHAGVQVHQKLKGPARGGDDEQRSH